MTRTRWIAGCMTGTSLDGLDVALAEIEGTGLDMKATFRGMVSKPLGDLAHQLRHFAEGKPAPPIDYLRAARELGELHADAVEELCRTHLKEGNSSPSSPPTPVGGFQAPKLDFIVAHGQTIWHAPTEHLSWQLFDPWPLVRRLGVPVCYDLRQADLIAGGQGAPITPITDWILYRNDSVSLCAIINLGGIANGTILRGNADETTGGDICACNIVIDGVVRALYPNLSFDRDGLIASGRYWITPWVDRIKAHPSFSRGDGRSLGREGYESQWFTQTVEAIRRDIEWDENDDSLVRSAVEAVADQIGEWIRSRGARRVILAGGGARNPCLRESIREHSRLPAADVLTSDDLGIPCEAREALAFAILGALSQDGVPITLPQVTGSANPGRSGAWVYP